MIACRDVLVAGSGPAAASVAMRLAARGADVLVIEGRPSPAPMGETLPPHTRTELVKSGFQLDALRGSWIESYGIEATWGAHKTFHSHVFDAEGPALHVERSVFVPMLMSQAQSAGAKVRSGHSLVRAVRHGGFWSASVRSSAGTSEVTSAYLVDATGRGARVATGQGIARRRFDRLCGVAAVVPRPVMPQALLVESVPYGWWYVAPFSTLHAVACLISDSDIVKSMGAHRPDAWLTLLKATRLPREPLRTGQMPRPELFPCETAILNEIVGAGWIAIGDAACSLDPLASAGIMKALHSGRLAADAVIGALGDGDVGVGSSRVDLQACKLEYSIVSPK